MPIKGRYFPSQESTEKVFLLVRRHWIIFFAIFSFIVILLIPVIILVIYWLANPDTFAGTLGNFVIVFAGMYTLAVFGLLLYGFVNYYLDVYIVTNKRIVDIKQNGFFRREIAELHLHQVQDVEAKVEGFFQTLIHFGNIYIQTAGEQENFIFEDVPHPYTLAKEIVELHEAQIESEYKPKDHFGRGHDHEVDDYRPEDFLEETAAEKPVRDNENVRGPVVNKDNLQSKKENDLEGSDGGIKYLEETYSPKTEEKFEEGLKSKDDNLLSNSENQPEEVGFGAGNGTPEKKIEKELKELSEGEEVSLDDQN